MKLGDRFYIDGRVGQIIRIRWRNSHRKSISITFDHLGHRVTIEATDIDWNEQKKYWTKRS